VTPARSPEHLAFVRTLPCLVCGRTPSDAAHFPGLRGMSQKRSDLETGPLCRIHHAEQHRIGWPRFIQTYELDVKAILAELREKPVLVVWSGISTLGFIHPRDPRFSGSAFYDTAYPRFIALYREQEFILRPVDEGLKASLDLAFRVCGEYLRDQLRERHLKKAS